MAKVKRKIGKPIQKKLPVESPDKIPEGQATLEDYEKMLTKIDNITKSDEETSDKSTEPQTDIETTLKVNEVTPEEGIEPQPIDKDIIDVSTDNTPVNSEYDVINDTTIPETETEISLIKMRNVDFYIEENRKLLAENKKLKDNNIDLEKQISRLNMISASLKSYLDKLINDRRLPPHTYSPNTYVNCGVVNPITGQQVVKPQVKKYMNGYESWN
jgi:hypothetical protein